MNAAPRSNKPWTIEEQNQLLIGLASGKSATAIASELKRTTRAIRRRAEVLELSWKSSKSQSAAPFTKKD